MRRTVWTEAQSDQTHAQFSPPAAAAAAATRYVIRQQRMVCGEKHQLRHAGGNELDAVLTPFSANIEVNAIKYAVYLLLD